MLLNLLREKREEILRLTRQYGASNVRIFGSVARNTEDDQSDVDLLITPLPGMTLLNHYDLVCELEKLLNRKVDLVSDRALRPRIRESVLKEALTL